MTEPQKHRTAMIIEDDTIVGLVLTANLKELGYQVAGQVSSSGEAIDLYRAAKPDLVLVDINLDGFDGIEVAERLLRERVCPMIVVSAVTDSKVIERAVKIGVFGYLVKPFTRDGLAAQIGVAVSRFAEREKLRDENLQLSQTLDAKKIVDKAKGLIMRRLSLDEPAAHRWLQLESQKRRISVCEMARLVLDAEPK